MLTQAHKGFTLIELLMVIAIIGILSAVVLASLGTARSKGQDAAIKTDLHNLQLQAEIYYYAQNPNTYGNQIALSQNNNACETAGGGIFSNTTVRAALAGADNANGSRMVACYANGTSYVAAAELTEVANTYWCVDSTGKAGLVSAAFPATGTLTVCPP